MASTNWFNFLLLLRMVILSIFNLCQIVVNGASIRYDQSQFGDYNVQIHLKNIELYAILDEGMLNSEYDYDYSELTEKPSSSSSHRPAVPAPNTTTTKPLITTTSNQSRFNLNSSSNSSSNNSNSNNNSLGSINSSALMITNQLLASPESMNATIEQEMEPLKMRKCAPGYYRDNLGRCRRLRKPHLPFLQMVHSPGVIKSFQQPTEQISTTQWTTVKASS